MQPCKACFVGFLVLISVLAFVLAPLSIFYSPAVVVLAGGITVTIVATSVFAIQRFWKF